MNTVSDMSKLSEVLFEIDPANTCCKENDAIDEYDMVALNIINRQHLIEESIEDAINETFSAFFEQELSEDQLKEIFEKMITNFK